MKMSKDWSILKIKKIRELKILNFKVDTKANDFLKNDSFYFYEGHSIEHTKKEEETFFTLRHLWNAQVVVVLPLG